MDNYGLEGNIEVARVLFARNGTQDWNWSPACWSRAH
jgi:hypothetical protein